MGSGTFSIVFRIDLVLNEGFETSLITIAAMRRRPTSTVTKELINRFSSDEYVNVDSRELTIVSGDTS